MAATATGGNENTSNPEVFNFTHALAEDACRIVIDKVERTVVLEQENQGGYDSTRINLRVPFVTMIREPWLRQLLMALIAEAEPQLRAEKEAGQ